MTARTRALARLPGPCDFVHLRHPWSRRRARGGAGHRRTTRLSKLLVAGDLCFPGPAPLDTWRRPHGIGRHLCAGRRRSAPATVDVDNLVPRASTIVKGSIARAPPHRARRAHLGALSKLPKTSRIAIETGGEILLVHGSPLDSSEPISHDMTDEEMSALIGDDPADIIVCGQATSLRSTDRRYPDRQRGLGRRGPGGQHAHATFVETSASGVVVEQFVVPLGRAA